MSKCKHSYVCMRLWESQPSREYVNWVLSSLLISLKIFTNKIFLQHSRFIHEELQRYEGISEQHQLHAKMLLSKRRDGMWKDRVIKCGLNFEMDQNSQIILILCSWLQLKSGSTTKNYLSSHFLSTVDCSSIFLVHPTRKNYPVFSTAQTRLVWARGKA